MSVINTNVMSLNAQRNLQTSGSQLATSLQRLSSGLRINSAKDDAAGLAISTRFTTQIRGLDQAARNANDGISLAQTAEGAMGEITNNLQRIRELAVQSRNATNSATDRAALNAEAQQLKSEIDRVASQTSFNGVKLLDGSFTSQSFQVGANQGQTISVDEIVDASSSALGSWTGIASATASGAPAGSGATAATAGRVTTGTITDFDYSDTAANFTVDGHAIALTTDLTDATGLVNALQTQLNAAAANTYNVANNAGVITISRIATGAGSAAPVIAGADAGATAAGFTGGTGTAGADASTGFTALSGAAFTVNGVNIEVGAAADATTRMNDLVRAINSSSAGATASIVNGALNVRNNDNTSNLVIGGTSGSVVTAQTGLATGTTARAANTGFASLDISSVAGADNAILAMDAALDSINTARGDMGAIQNRFASVVANLTTTSENLSSARSRIQDADYAKETAQLTRNQILQQAGQAMLAQANQAPQGVLSLLR
jgi:flagellin